MADYACLLGWTCSDGATIVTIYPSDWKWPDAIMDGCVPALMVPTPTVKEIAELKALKRLVDAARNGLSGITLEYATDLIWAMEDKPGFIGLRVDCGDAGTIYFTRDQARQVIEVFQKHIGEEA